MALTVCERWMEKYAALDPVMHVAPNGARQFRCRTPGRDVIMICTWIMKNERLSYASGFLFGNEGLEKLSARDATALLDQALNSKSARG